MSEWLMEEELEYAELLELYEEARRDVDRLRPRRGTNQADWLFGQMLRMPGFHNNWFSQHYLMSELRMELSDKGGPAREDY